MRRPDKPISAPAHMVQFATYPNASAISGASVSRLERLVKAGTIRAKRLDGRVLIDVPFLLAWLNDLPDWSSKAA